MGMSVAEKEQLVEVVHGMSDEQLAVVAQETPTDILISVISDRMKDMESRILSTVDALHGRTDLRSRREISVIGGN